MFTAGTDVLGYSKSDRLWFLLKGRNQSLSYCIHNKNKPPAMQVCSQIALASSKNLLCYNKYRFANRTKKQRRYPNG